MVFRGVASHDEDDIGIGNVGPTVGHGPSAEGGGQTGHRGAVSKPGLILVGENAETEAKLSQQKVDLVRVGAAADERQVLQSIHRPAGGVFFLESGVACVLDAARHATDGFVPRDGLPGARARSTIERFGEPAVVVDVLFERDALRAERSSVDRAVRIAFDVNDARLHVLSGIAKGVDDDAAADGTIGANALRLCRARDLELAGAERRGTQIKAECRRRKSGGAGLKKRVYADSCG